MFVKLFTGLPGAGKTAQLVNELVRLSRDEAHRPRYYMGINGLADGVAIPATQAQLERWWEEFPPGSIIAIDECQEEHLMPKDRGNPSAWVQRIAKVRHYGMTFLLTTQHPANMSAFVRRLVDQHVHTVCKFGTSVISRYTWGRCMDDPEKGSAQKASVEDIGTLPKEVFELYKSSQLHTRKPRIPRKVYYLAALVVTGIASVVAVPALIKRAQARNMESIQGKTAIAEPGKAPVTREQPDPGEQLRREDFAKWMRPRVDGLPWSAPMFDHLQVKAVPNLFCVAVDDGRCTCHTEQGTRYAVPADRCRRIVADGLYNPFVEGLQTAQEQASRNRGRSGEPQAPTGHDLGTIDESSAPAHKERGTATAYTPPEYHQWNADPWGSAKSAR
ncbi:zonular occludens toxin domain-containing protein [Dyella soli]|uniref:Zona occludens toxin N-terminal domain-containing protein n=1 Tax=Dyella soli TaxID=522319 RepID=A0A4R0YUD7_9GAMM|nr:zonular occludens toxin domain-containing protein [Dyella soli]TCI10122.1 hypothetical protein EZM97_14480 [Dyella soli]